MRGVDLASFAFDYDLTWAAFFQNADGQTYGRFGGRAGEDAEKYLTLAGLKHALRAALEAHKLGATEPETRADPRRPEEYPAAKKMKANACIHCHQVWDFRRDERYEARKATLDDLWVYPPPDNVGLTLDPDQGDRVVAVKDGSPAAKAGLRAGDVLATLHGRRIASFADAQHALHLAPVKGSIEATWRRGDEKKAAMLELPEGWRRSDISWRASMWTAEPQASTYGRDLTAAEKKGLGLSEKALAFRQGNFVAAPAREAGVRGGDIVLGFEGRSWEMSMLQFNAHVRTHYKPGDRVVYQVVRGGEKLTIPMTLPGRR